jgi:hypothetical protein
MKQKLLLLLFLLVSSLSEAQNLVDTVRTNITTNTTWRRDRIYLIEGYRFVKDGATLTIEPGTTIRGDKASKGTLIITKTGKILANGNDTMPIVFTSNQPQGTRTYGDWGGIVILGNAPINVPGGIGIIEGGLLGQDATYGGNNQDDSSGVFRYVRIEYPGIAYQPNSEINGLTLGGVGRKTQIDHIQVSYSGDDAFEWFGGNVNCKYLVAHRGWDDDFDTDFGYSGKVQFALSMRDPNISDQSQSNGLESDNDGTGTFNTPFTSPLFSNVTIIGPREGGNPASLYRRAMHLRRNTRTSIYNSLFTGYTTGLHIDGQASQAAATLDSLQLERVILCNMLNNFEQTSGQNTWQGMNSYFLDSTRQNQIIDSTFRLGLRPGYANLGSPDLVPDSGSLLLSGANFTNPRLSDGFFDTVSFIGAFGLVDWTRGWSNFNPDTVHTSVEVVNRTVTRVYPNPVTQGLFTIQLDELPQDVRVFDIRGREVQSSWSQISEDAIRVSLDTNKVGLMTVLIQDKLSLKISRIVVR